ASRCCCARGCASADSRKPGVPRLGDAGSAQRARRRGELPPASAAWHDPCFCVLHSRRTSMRTALFAISFALACQAAPSQPRAQAEQPAPSPTPASITGKVLERIDAAQYTYLRLETAQGLIWAAVPTTKRAVGSMVTVLNPIWMENFTSTTLHRTWPRIAFGTLDAESGPMPAELPPGHGAARPAVDSGSIRVAHATGPQGRTVADVWAQRLALKDKKISVRGKVVKATNGVLGKNWQDLRDGKGR